MCITMSPIWMYQRHIDTYTQKPQCYWSFPPNDTHKTHPKHIPNTPRKKQTHRMVSTTKHASATPAPIFPINPASAANLHCNGVSSASTATRVIVFPHSLLGPTATTSNRPEPSATLVPARHQQSLPGPTLLWTGSASPVRALSSMRRSLAVMRMPSAATLSPIVGVCRWVCV